MRPLMERITDALQREHDLIEELRNLSKEFDEFVLDIASTTARLQQRFEPQPPAVTQTGKVVQMPKIEADDNFLPNVLKGGPNKREP